MQHKHQHSESQHNTHTLTHTECESQLQLKVEFKYECLKVSCAAHKDRLSSLRPSLAVLRAALPSLAFVWPSEALGGEKRVFRCLCSSSSPLRCFRIHDHAARRCHPETLAPASHREGACREEGARGEDPDRAGQSFLRVRWKCVFTDV